MTLIELLITITIIAVLSTTFLGVSRLAMESSREARTKTTIGKIHSLLMEKWAEYPTRRVDIDEGVITAAFSDRKARGLALADVRLIALRELMLLEMPDSWSDILGAPVGTPLNSLPGTQVLRSFPALRNIYLRRYFNLKKDPSISEQAADIVANEGAECLYMIVMLATGDGEARSTFSEQDIGDTDDDGAPEFLDGWGRPIHFIRWPAGFAVRSDLMLGEADSDHDAFDLYRRDFLDAQRPNIIGYPVNVQTFVNELADDNFAFRLVPLIYSAGADGETDIDDAPYTGAAPPTSLDPYAIDPNPLVTPSTAIIPNVNNYVFGLPKDMNQDGDDNSLDNIHNHLQDNR